jgi:hypothetical protein
VKAPDDVLHETIDEIFLLRSPLIFSNGSTAMDGLSGRASGTSTGDDGGATVAGAETLQSGASHFTPNA